MGDLNNNCEMKKDNNIKTDELIEKYLPLTVEYSDYVHQGTSLRDMRSRIITVSAKVDCFKLNPREKNKLLHLLGSRYNHTTKSLKFDTDRLGFFIYTFSF